MKEWVYTPFSPFPDPISVDGDSTTTRMVLAPHPIDGAWIQLSNGYSNVLLPPLVEERYPLEKWASPSTEEMAKSWPDVRYHHTHQNMVCKAPHGRPWFSRIERNRETPTQVLDVENDIKGTTNHAPETESWRVSLLASETGRYDSHI